MEFSSTSPEISPANFKSMARKIFTNGGPISELFLNEFAPMCSRIGYDNFLPEQQMLFFIEFQRVLGLRFHQRREEWLSLSEVEQEAFYLRCAGELARTL